jgi:hypothetical protein
LGTEFRSEKIPRNRLGTVSVIPRKKALIPRHSDFRGRANSEARNGTERNGIPRKKLVHETEPLFGTCIEGGRVKLCTNVVKYTLKLGKVLRKSSKITSQNDLSLLQKSSIRLPRFVLLVVFSSTEWFSSAEWFETEFREFASISVSWNGIPSCVLFRRRVRNKIMGVCFYFCSTERYSKLFSLPRKGLERNSEIFCSAEQPEFRRK